MIIAFPGVSFQGSAPSYPPAGTHLSSRCSGFSGPNSGDETYYDASGNTFNGMFTLWQEFADGSGGSYMQSQGAGSSDQFTSCWYPAYYYTNSSSGENYVYWNACGNDGNFGPTGNYYSWTYSNGDGNYTSDSGSSDYDPPYGGDLIYQNGCCEVRYDGGSGYYTNDTCGYPPYGTVLNSFCGGHWDTPHYIDASGNQWDGAFTLYHEIADGNGGYFQDSGSENSDPCFYPDGYVVSAGEGESRVDWNGCGNSGSFGYATYWFAEIANGNGTTRWNGGGSDYGYYAGYLISDYGCCYIRYDGSGGYYEDNQCESGCPGAGQYVGTGCISTDGVDASGAYFEGAWQYGDYYTDGNCGTYASPTGGNTNGCYYPSGWKFDYSSGSNNFDWYVQDSQQNNVASGNFTYYTWWASADVADGNGGTSGASGSWNAYSGQQIDFGFYTEPSDGNLWWYQVSSDGGSGYYVSQNLW